MPTLYVVSSEGSVFQFPLVKEKTTIGRSKDNDLVLPDERVSRHHAGILKTKEGFILNDLGSYNGTLLNGKTIQSSSLIDRDEIKVGLTKLTFLEEMKTPNEVRIPCSSPMTTDMKAAGTKLFKAVPGITWPDPKNCFFRSTAKRPWKRARGSSPA